MLILWYLNGSFKILKFRLLSNKFRWRLQPIYVENCNSEGLHFITKTSNFSLSLLYLTNIWITNYNLKMLRSAITNQILLFSKIFLSFNVLICLICHFKICCLGDFNLQKSSNKFKYLNKIMSRLIGRVVSVSDYYEVTDSIPGTFTV